MKSKEGSSTPKELLWKYLAYSPIFVVSLIITFVIGIYNIRYTQPIYSVTTRIFIKTSNDNKIGGSGRSGGAGGDLIENSLFSSKQVNLDNEIALITTYPLIQKIVQDHHFNHYYYTEGNIRRSEVYKSVPFEVIDSSWADSNSACHFYVKNLTDKGGDIQFNGNSQDKTKYPFQWDQWLFLRGNRFKIVLRNAGSQLSVGNKNEEVYYFAYAPVAATVSEIKGNLLVSPYNAKTTIIKLDLKGANVSKCADILNALIAEYSRQSVDDKSTQLTNTIEFINQRLDFVTKELGGVENDLKDFKNSNQIIDLSGQSGQAIGERAKLEQQLTDLEVQEKLFLMIDQKIRSMPADKLQTIPNNIGIEGGQHAAVFDNYNKLVLKKLRDEPLIGKNSPVLKDLNAQLQLAYLAVLQTLSEYEQSLAVQKNALLQKSKKFESLVTRMPGQEKTFVEIKRQQNVKEGLYLYLLQKREESAIATSSTISNYLQLEPANGSNNPLEPNRRRIYIFSLIFGLLIPIVIIYTIDLFDDKVRSREHITSRTKMPIIAEIGHIPDSSGNLVVADKSRNIVAEQFRILRTNLNFLLQDKKTIMVTSTVSGEGKSFIALNLAAVFAISGKKVAILEFDLRKPRIIKNVGLEKKNIGLSNYLSRQTDQLSELYYQIDNYPTLHIYACGPIPPNPSELMLGERMESLFTELKNQYDYIVVDTAPVGLVSDAFNIIAYVDTCIYVVRQRKTLKKQLFFINDMFVNKQLQNVGMVINDVKVGARHGYYGHNYGYGYGYGYGRNYGYGYGKKSYGDYFDQEKESGMIGRFIRKLFSKKNKKRKTG